MRVCNFLVPKFDVSLLQLGDFLFVINDLFSLRHVFTFWPNPRCFLVPRAFYNLIKAKDVGTFNFLKLGRHFAILWIHVILNSVVEWLKQWRLRGKHRLCGHNFIFTYAIVGTAAIVWLKAWISADTQSRVFLRWILIFRNLIQWRRNYTAVVVITEQRWVNLLVCLSEDTVLVPERTQLLQLRDLLQVGIREVVLFNKVVIGEGLAFTNDVLGLAPVLWDAALELGDIGWGVGEETRDSSLQSWSRSWSVRRSSFSLAVGSGDSGTCPRLLPAEWVAKQLGTQGNRIHGV